MVIFLITLTAARDVHNAMIKRVTNAPINLFFDVTPTGTVLNRFSKDLQMLDQNLCFSIGGLNVMMYQAISVLVIVVWANWYIAAMIPVVLLFVIPLLKVTIRAYKETIRIENVSKSPMLNLMNETISGGCTIRAFGKQKEFVQNNNQLLDRNILAN